MKKVKGFIENVWDFGRFMTMVDKIILGVCGGALGLLLFLRAVKHRKCGVHALLLAAFVGSGAFLTKSFLKHIR